MRKVLVLHGPNLNLLGKREPEVYGKESLTDIDRELAAAATPLGLDLECYQSNHEGELIDALHSAMERCAGVIFNPGGYTHTSVALRDAIKAITIPVIEVHISNVYAREEFRHHSLLSAACAGKIVGFGWRSYLLALYALATMINKEAG